jgi:F0F1-type ATP synthase assembly protein I
MILTRDPDSRRIAARILSLQAITTILLAAACYGAWGTRHGVSALAGGAIGLAANVVMIALALRPTRTAGGALLRLLVGQAAKIGLVVALIVIAARTGKVVWPPFLGAYFATLLAFWAAPMVWPVRPTANTEEGKS